jgi:hypothetical protein
MKHKIKDNWRKVDWDCYVCDNPDGMAFASDDGWRVHHGAYRESLVEPIIGPMLSLPKAIEKFEEAMKRQDDNDRRKIAR